MIQDIFSTLVLAVLVLVFCENPSDFFPTQTNSSEEKLCMFVSLCYEDF